MKDRLVLEWWLLVFLLPIALAPIYPRGEGFFLLNAAFSAFLVYILLDIKISLVTLIIAGLEGYAIFVNLMGCMGYMTGLNGYMKHFTDYSAFINLINLTEVVLLTIRPLYDGIIFVFRRFYYPLRLYFANILQSSNCNLYNIKGYPGKIWAQVKI